MKSPYVLVIEKNGLIKSLEWGEVSSYYKVLLHFFHITFFRVDLDIHCKSNGHFFLTEMRSASTNLDYYNLSQVNSKLTRSNKATL